MRAKSAIALFKRFNGYEPPFVTTYDIRVPNEGALLGHVDKIFYRSKKWDRTWRRFFHNYKKPPKMLAVSGKFEGKPCDFLIIIGGKQKITARGIVG